MQGVLYFLFQMTDIQKWSPLSVKVAVVAQKCIEKIYTNPTYNYWLSLAHRQTWKDYNDQVWFFLKKFAEPDKCRMVTFQISDKNIKL